MEPSELSPTSVVRAPVFEVCHARANWRNNAKDPRQPIQTNVQISNFLDTVYVWASQECTDPRDKIFAFLGILPSHNDKMDYRFPFQADYRETFKDVCADIISLITNFGREDPKGNITYWMRLL